MRKITYKSLSGRLIHRYPYLLFFIILLSFQPTEAKISLSYLSDIDSIESVIQFADEAFFPFSINYPDTELSSSSFRFNSANPDVRFEYNATASNKTISLDGNYVDVKNVQYSGNVVLKPFSSIVLIRSYENTTPLAPTLTADDNANTLNATHTLGTSEILVSINNGTYAAYSGSIAVGNVARATGYWKFKIRSATGRNESAISESVAFTVANTSPPAPILTADDNANTLNATHTLGTSQILVSINNGTYAAYNGSIAVGNVARAVGYWKFKIRSATGRNESAVISSPAFTVANTTHPAPTLTADDNANTLNATHNLGTSEILVSINNGTYAAYSGSIAVGNVARATGYWKFKIRSATGRNESAISESVAFTVANTSPPAPILTADDNANTLNATHTLGTSEILVSINNGTYAAYSGSIAVGNVARATGYWKFKIRSATGRNESAISESVAFTVANTSPPAPILTADDNANTLNATHTLGTSQILVSINNGTYAAYNGSIAVGNVARAVGYWKFKIRSATGRNESAVISSPAFTVANTSPPAPILTADDNANTLNATHTLGTSQILVSINNGTYAAYNGSIAVGNVARAVGYWKFKIRSATGRNESAVISSPAFTVANTTHPAPTLTADDNANTLNATHTLGTSEILVSINNGTYAAYSGSIAVGNVARATGYWKFKIRSATGRNESAISESVAFTVANTSPPAPILTADDNANTLNATHTLGTSEILVSENNDPYLGYTGTIAVGNIARASGYWKFKIKSATGRDEGEVVSSPSFTNTITSLDNTIVPPLELTVYPNPVETILQVDHDIVQTPATLEIMSLDGRKLKQVKLEPGNSHTNIDVQFLSKGVYLLEYKISSRRVTKIIIKL